MKKSTSVIIGVVVLVVVVVGAYLIFHKSSSPSYSSTSGSNSGTASKASGPSVNNSVFKTMTSSSLGKYLTDPSGRALYTYNGDSSGVSNCTGTCLANWPAYIAKGEVGLPSGVDTLTRSDNHKIQYTYNGMPLYYFAGDSGSQVTGNGVDNFSVARPAASSSSASTSSGSSSSSSSSASGSSTSTPNYPY